MFSSRIAARHPLPVQNISVTILNDTIPELDEIFYVSILSFSGGGLLGSQRSLPITILKNDVRPWFAERHLCLTQSVKGLDPSHPINTFSSSGMPSPSEMATAGFYSSTVSVAETPNAITPASLTVVLSAPAPFYSTVTFSVPGGTATNNTDYLLGSGKLIFNVGESSKVGTHAPW